MPYLDDHGLATLWTKIKSKAASLIAAHDGSSTAHSSLFAEKQDAIADLASIRSGAAKGAAAYSEAVTTVEGDGALEIADALQGSRARGITVQGRSFKWNQRFSCGAKTYSGTGYSVTHSADNPIFTITATETATSDTGNMFSVSAGAFVEGHSFAVLMLGDERIRVHYKSNGGGTSDQILTATGGGFSNAYFMFTDLPAGTYECTPILVDLTAMFGAGNEPTTTSDPRIEQIKAYAAEHPEYDAGSVKCVEPKTYRWNQLLQQSGTTRTLNGVTTSRSDGVFNSSGTTSTNYFNIMLNTELDFLKTDGNQGHVFAFLLDIAENGLQSSTASFGFFNRGASVTVGTGTGEFGFLYTDNSTSIATSIGFAHVTTGAEVSAEYSVHICDLTAIFGAGNEPATVEAFKQTFEYRHSVNNGYAEYWAGPTKQLDGLIVEMQGAGASSETTIGLNGNKLLSAGDVHDELTVDSAGNAKIKKRCDLVDGEVVVMPTPTDVHLPKVTMPSMDGVATADLISAIETRWSLSYFILNLNALNAAISGRKAWIQGTTLYITT